MKPLPPPDFSPRPSRRCGRVLVVDDDPIAQMILRRWLEIWDLPSEVYGDGAAAFVPSQQSEFTLAIIDYNLPDMKGLDLIRLMRNAARANGTRCPVFALHTTDSETRDLARKEQIDFFLHKPLSSSELLLVIKEAGCKPRTSECEIADLNRTTQLQVTLQPTSKSIMPIR